MSNALRHFKQGLTFLTNLLSRMGQILKSENDLFKGIIDLKESIIVSHRTWIEADTCQQNEQKFT